MARLVYTGERLREIAFPLGGIGTGTISLGGRGQLRDFEIANRPAKGQAKFRNFFALGVDDGSGVPKARILERQFFPPFTGSRGVPNYLVPGLPRFSEVKFVGEYPWAHLEFQDGATSKPFPVRVSLDAYNPMIPGNVEDSGLPTAIFNWHFENRSPGPISGVMAAFFSNLVGYSFSPWRYDPPWEGGQQVNRLLSEPGMRGVRMESEHDGKRHPSAGTMAVVTPWPDTSVQTFLEQQDCPYSLRPYWYQLLGQVPINGHDRDATGSPADSPTLKRRLESTLLLEFSLEPGEQTTLPVIVTWHFPNRYVDLPGLDAPRWIGNYYTTKFGDAVDVARYVLAEGDRLESETRSFHDHLFATTVPDSAIDAVSANLSTIRSQTCFRDATGQFYGYEGCNDDSGCCPMNCTHVWMYEQALAFLYPQLERDMRTNSFLTETEPDGRMHFRTRVPNASDPFPAEARAAADGQLSEVIQLLRDYRISGDRDFLARLWPKAKLALEYAWRPGGWDADRDGIIEGEQHNTTDIAFYGPNPLITFIYNTALRAGAIIARTLGDEASAAEYERIANQGAPQADSILWNGDYYQQRLDLAAPQESFAGAHMHGEIGDKALLQGASLTSKHGVGEAYNQVHDGCLADQLFGLWMASIVGIDPFLPRERILAALRAIHRHNFRRMDEVPTNFLRAFAVNDEMGLLYANFPNAPGEIIPLTAVFRAHEVWSGCEYQAASHMIREGLIAEGESIVEAIRTRHDGSARNPWNEPECGDHYARALASYGLLLAYARIDFDLSAGRISLAPQVNRSHFTTFFSVEGAWGTISVQGTNVQINVAQGELTLREIVLDGIAATLPAETKVTPSTPLTVTI
jgi:non-lysosomal glucosylceramidase